MITEETSRQQWYGDAAGNRDHAYDEEEDEPHILNISTSTLGNQ